MERARPSPVRWLLEADNPPIRYGTLRDLLERPAGDPEVRAASSAIPSFPPLAQLLAAQKHDGYWVGRDYYLPKNAGTFWTLCVLADMGLTREHPAVQRGVAYLLAHQRQDGAFCRRRRISGQGIVQEPDPDPCTHARIVRLLIQFGYGEDAQTRAGMAWLLATQRQDGMWLCPRPGRHGCLRATLDYLRAAVLDPAAAVHPATARAAAVLAGLLMQPGMGRYHVDDQWTVLEYPYVGYGVIPALDALGRLGYTTAHPQVAAAVEYLLSRQLPSGAWPLDRHPHRPALDFGRPGEPSKWLTLDALRVLKRLG